MFSFFLPEESFRCSRCTRCIFSFNEISISRWIDTHSFLWLFHILCTVRASFPLRESGLSVCSHSVLKVQLYIKDNVAPLTRSNLRRYNVYTNTLIMYLYTNVGGPLLKTFKKWILIFLVTRSIAVYINTLLSRFFRSPFCVALSFTWRKNVKNEYFIPFSFSFLIRFTMY